MSDPGSRKPSSVAKPPSAIHTAAEDTDPIAGAKSATWSMLRWHRPTVTKLLEWLRPYWRLAIAYVALVVLATFVEGFGILSILPLLDATDALGSVAGPLSFLPPDALPALTAADRARLAAIVLLVVAVLRGSLIFFVGVLSHLIPVKVERDARLQLIDRLLVADLAMLGTVRSGRIQDAIAIHVTYVGNAVQTVLRAIGQLLVLLVYGVVLFLISPLYAIISFLLLSAIAVLFRLVLFLPITRTTKRENAARESAMQRCLDLVRGLEVVRSFGREAWFRDQFVDEVSEIATQRVRGGRLQSSLQPVAQVVVAVLMGALLLIGSLLHDETDRTWLARAGLFVLLLVRLLVPAASLFQQWGTFTRFAPSLFELERTLAACAPAPPCEGGEAASESTELREAAAMTRDGFGEIELDGVSIGYPGSPAVLRDVRLGIRQGTFVAICGPSGAGKTTLIRALVGSLPLRSGPVRIDGEAIDPTTPAWRRRFAFVGQEPFLFPGTIEENLRFAKPSATEADLRDALRAANADAFVASLPQGLQTPLGDIVSGLSGGQKQRLAIARALLADRSIIVLDEPTSALDAVSERSIAETLERLTPDRTVVVVAHREETIRAAGHRIEVADGTVHSGRSTNAK